MRCRSRKCDRDHVRGCKGHRGKNHATDPGGPCGKYPMHGQDVCGSHGGKAPQNRAAGQRRYVEAKARAKLGDAGEPVIDPIGKLCAIAGRAVAFMEALSARVAKLETSAEPDEVRAELAVYGRSIKDAAGVVESIIRMGIAERLAKVDEQQTAAIIAFIDGVLADLGHNPRAPEVAGVVAARLELVS